jgi:hypothetical protein
VHEGKKEKVVETTFESHEKTSMDNSFKIRGSCPLENFISPEYLSGCKKSFWLQ